MTEIDNKSESLRNITENNGVDDTFVLRKLFDLMPQLGWTATADGWLDYYNTGFYEYTGCTYEQLKGWGWQQVHHPDHIARVLKSWQQILASGQPGELEFPLRRHDGIYRYFLTRINPIHNEQNQLVRWVGINTDITEQKQKEVDEKKRSELLERLNAELEQFAYIASHDLQEPLRAIAGCLQILQKNYENKLDSEAHELIRLSVDSAVRLHNMTYDLLSLSRVNSENPEFHLVSLTDILSTVKQNLRLSIEEKKVTIGTNSLSTAWGDTTQLTQLFQNLIANAIKFSNASHPHIEINMNEEGNYSLFSIHDNGIGFDQEHAERIFQPFKRLHSSDNYAGSGMGLAICKKIVERHGGEIWAKSEANKGTTFYFTLPNK